MRFRHWLAGTALIVICAISLAAVLGAALAAAFGVVLAPFAFIGFLIGPAESLNLKQFAPTIAVWAGTAATASLLALWSSRRWLNMYRKQAWSTTALAASMGIGIIVSATLLAAGVRAVTELTPAERLEQQATVAPLPYLEADKTGFDQNWLPRAQAGDAYAQFVVGEALQNGAMGQPLQRDAAKLWLDKSAAQGDVDATWSLMLARRQGLLGFAQEFAMSDRVPAFAETQPAARRIALWLWLANNPVIKAGSGAPNMVAISRWRNQWLEQAARAGSRYAAWQLARELETARDADSNVAPDIQGAARWYAAAGSSNDVNRLQAASDPTPAAAIPQIPHIETTEPQLIERLRQRALLSAVRQRHTVVSPGTEDARTSFIAYSEATGNYRQLAELTMTGSVDGYYVTADPALAKFLHSLAVDGDVHAAAKRQTLPER